jgi:hypothetical protein
MALTVPNIGETLLLQFMVGDAAPHANWTLRLFVNNYTPVPATLLANLTEMSTQGYTAQVLTNTSWVISAEDPEAQALYAEQTFTFDGTGGDTDVYGYYLTDNSAGALLWAERFPTAPILVPDSFGGQIRITPRITFATLNEM